MIISYTPLCSDTEHDRSQVIVRNRDMEMRLGYYRLEVITGDNQHLISYLPLHMIWWELEALAEAYNIDHFWVNDNCNFPLMSVKVN